MYGKLLPFCIFWVHENIIIEDPWDINMPDWRPTCLIWRQMSLIGDRHAWSDPLRFSRKNCKHKLNNLSTFENWMCINFLTLLTTITVYSLPSFITSVLLPYLHSKFHNIILYFHNLILVIYNFIVLPWPHSYFHNLIPTSITS